MLDKSATDMVHRGRSVQPSVVYGGQRSSPRKLRGHSTTGTNSQSVTQFRVQKVGTTIIQVGEPTVTACVFFVFHEIEQHTP